MQDFFDRVLEILLDLSATSSYANGPVFDHRRQDFGVLNATISYGALYFLYITIGIDMSSGDPYWQFYSFHFQKASGDLVFRYDNSPHYPDLLTFPHHKHLGPEGEVEASRQPAIHQIAREMAQHLERQ